MEIKKWEEYTKEEQTNYLTYWFHYYGNMMYNFQELEDFRKLASTRQDEIFDHIVTEFIFRDTIQSGTLLLSMRKNKVEELFKTNLDRGKIKEEGLSEYEKIRYMIVAEITGSNKNNNSTIK